MLKYNCMFLDPSNPGKSVLVGIVSRGKGCGQTGQTGRFIHTVHCTLVTCTGLGSWVEERVVVNLDKIRLVHTVHCTVLDNLPKEFSEEWQFPNVQFPKRQLPKGLVRRRRLQWSRVLWLEQARGPNAAARTYLKNFRCTVYCAVCCAVFWTVCCTVF